MPDTLLTQSSTPATLPAGTKIATRSVTYSGDANSHLAPVALVTLSGTDDAITATDVVLPAALGTNGGLKVAIVSDSGTPSVLDADNVAGVSFNTKYIMYGATSLTPKYAVIASAASGNNTLIAAVSAKKIRVLAYNFMASGTVNVKFQSGASGTDLTGLKYCVANVGIVAPFNPAGWFETATNTLLNLNLSGAIAVGGELMYVEI